MFDIVIYFNKVIVNTRMDDLVFPQIKDSCKIALPNGLRELMSDISREICEDLSNCRCELELETELQQIGLPEADIETAKDIIVNYFAKDHVKESSLLRRLMKKTIIDEDMIPAVQDAIRNAFMRHWPQKSTVFESSSESEADSVMCAAKHTLNLYRQAASGDTIKYEIMAQKIQNAYRAYGVRRDCKLGKRKETKPADKVVTLVDPKIVAPPNPYETVYPQPVSSEGALSGNSTNWTEDPEVELSAAMNQRRLNTISSTSIAGSFLTLPSYRPYSVHDDVLSDLMETPEREHAIIDYTAPNPHVSITSADKPFYTPGNKQTSNEDTGHYETASDCILYDNESKVSIRNVSSEEDFFYRPNVMNADDSYDGDTEIGPSDGNKDKGVRSKVMDQKDQRRN
ncbi:uncharacterized protein LOC118273928 isoform X2 [Spodoptera frugiperda]|uniref:Uncharacterized protein LOC118273928 isoform X2 n=1 Tax=Spodoptera frugiperda TaxID=7108 RepID=A0A9R0DBC0_SPOFR|nr:uncharacterized protein LOC118273928 isoform X2 [Spodoptera frugiperda]